MEEKIVKRVISFSIAVILCVMASYVSISAKQTDIQYTGAQIEKIHMKYTNLETMLNGVFGNDTGIGYWSCVNKMNQNKFISGSIDMASKMIGEYPDKKKFAEIIVNLIAMQEGELAEQVENQSRFDDLKTETDYALDLVDMASSFCGDNIAPIVDAATGGKDTLIKSLDQAKYYEMSIQDYSNANGLLYAISHYATNKELREVASSLINANKTLLQKRLEYISDASATLGEYEAEFFVGNLGFELLKTADLYKTDETVKWFVDCGTGLANKILDAYSLGSFAFKATMFAGDIGFGTTNTFNRYQEMKTVADIAESLVKAINETDLNDKQLTNKTLPDIQKQCNYYKMLIVAHTRGEYLIYQLVSKDAGVLSELKTLFETFGDPNETTESWYKGQNDVMIKNYDEINGIFVIEKEDLSEYINDFNHMYDVIGGNPSSETGDHEKWILGEGIQYGNYIGSKGVDDISLFSAEYSLFNVFVKQKVDEAKNRLIENGWNLEEGDAEYQQYKKDNLNLQYSIEGGCISNIAFWKDMLLKEENINNSEGVTEEEKEYAIGLAKQKFGDEYSYFCNEGFIYQGKEYLCVDVKTRVEGHLTRVTQVLVAKDGSYVGEGSYFNNGGSEQIEFYE